MPQATGSARVLYVDARFRTDRDDPVDHRARVVESSVDYAINNRVVLRFVENTCHAQDPGAAKQLDPLRRCLSLGRLGRRRSRRGHGGILRRTPRYDARTSRRAARPSVLTMLVGADLVVEFRTLLPVELRAHLAPIVAAYAEHSGLNGRGVGLALGRVTGTDRESPACRRLVLTPVLGSSRADRQVVRVGITTARDLADRNFVTLKRRGRVVPSRDRS
jgi:hypothetical protein